MKKPLPTWADMAATNITPMTAMAANGVRNPRAMPKPPANSVAPAAKAWTRPGRNPRYFSQCAPVFDRPPPPNQPNSFWAPWAARVDPSTRRSSSSPIVTPTSYPVGPVAHQPAARSAHRHPIRGHVGDGHADLGQAVEHVLVQPAGRARRERGEDDLVELLSPVEHVPDGAHRVGVAHLSGGLHAPLVQGGDGPGQAGFGIGVGRASRVDEAVRSVRGRNQQVEGARAFTHTLDQAFGEVLTEQGPVGDDEVAYPRTSSLLLLTPSLPPLPPGV